MGDKYIIEVESIYKPVPGFGCEPVVLYKAKGFNSLVFDEEGLNKLEKYDPDKEYDRGYEQGFEVGKYEATSREFEDGYEKGLNDAWEAARKIVSADDSALSGTELKKIFGTCYLDAILEGVTAEKAIEKIKAYEKKKKAEVEIRVGDEVQVNSVKGIVTRTKKTKDGDLWIDIINSKGCGFLFSTTMNTVTKTGRYFHEVAKLLEKMKVVDDVDGIRGEGENNGQNI